MFFSDWRLAKIERATLSGRQRVTIVTSNLVYPNKVDLDRRNKLVFWVDAFGYRVESVDYNGNNRKLLVKISGTFMNGVAFLYSSLFITDSNKPIIYEINAFKASGSIITSFQFSTLSVARLIAYRSSQQPIGMNWKHTTCY